MVWITENWGEVSVLIGTIIGVAEVVVRMFPTIDEGGAVERVGGMIKKFLDMMKFPNILKGPK